MAISNYLLGRDFHASNRLYLQHWMWRRNFGYLLHPKVPIEKDKDINIIDVACGTGIWLIDLAKELPHARLDGFDISPLQFPHKNWLPPNVNLHELNALGKMPEELLGRYDIVHIGLVVLLVPGGDPTVLVDNILSLLSRVIPLYLCALNHSTNIFTEPGGYLQWNEADIENLPRIAASETVPRARCDEFYTRIYEAVDRQGMPKANMQWVRELSQILSNHPDVQSVVADEQHLVPDDLAQPASQIHLSSVGEMLQQLDPKIVEDMKLVELYNGAMEEMQQGMSVRMGQVVVVARKRDLGDTGKREEGDATGTNGTSGT